ncbi:dsDNA nuclease domain-containing protein [Aliivibrio sifiae]|uniref:dsDNA nuclease domain-containing protein n=1 Tax=Aliivibrio sifiae TaxID=566293 RepID=UPI003D09FA47
MLGNNLYVNAGVEAGTGFSFQRCSALFVLLDNFSEFKNKQYFLCFEHHDDFLFAFLDECNALSYVNAYQAKKASTKWSTDSKLIDIIRKLTISGNGLRNDNIVKNSDYYHNLHFITNKAINLSNGVTGKEREKIIINDAINKFKYVKLADKIKSNILAQLNNDFYDDEIDNINFEYIDLANKHNSNVERLIGKMTCIFGAQITDYNAAVKVLLTLFNQSELIYNQNNEASLNDLSKRISSVKIEETLNILTDEARAYDFWRIHANELCKTLKVNLNHKRKADEYLSNCFDYFKDLENIEFIKILHFVRDNEDIDGECFDEVSGIEALYNEYTKHCKSKLQPYMICFAIIAAYVETRG